MGILVLKQKQTWGSHQTEIYSYDEILFSILPVAWILFSVRANTVCIRTLAIHYINILINDIKSAESDIISNICFDIMVYLCFLLIFTSFQIKETYLFFLWGLCKLKNATVCYSPFFFNATVNWQICSHMLTSRLKLNCNKHNFCIWINIDLFMCLIGRNSQWSGCNNRWSCNRERGVGCCSSELMCELFQECLRGNVLIGTLRLDKDVRFKRSKAIIKYTTGRCCSKNIFALARCPPPHPAPHSPTTTPPNLFFFSFSHFIWLFLARGEKKISSPSG